jgi:arylformamidase
MSTAALTGYTPEFVERGYNNRAAVPDHPRWFTWYAEKSAAARAALSHRADLRYGPGPKETLDLFLPEGASRGTFVFLHGGYWRALDKSDVSFVAAPFVAQGLAFASVNYDLCPAVTVAAIVDACRRAVAWLAREGGKHGASPGRIVVGGNSAGGHLAAMLLATDPAALGLDARTFAGAVSVSGVHDLTPLVLFSFNVDLKLDVGEALRLSPVFLSPGSGAPLLLAVGADETAEFLRQTWIQWDRWPRNRPAGAPAPLIVPGCDHFSILAEYADGTSTLTRETLALF